MRLYLWCYSKSVFAFLSNRHWFIHHVFTELYTEINCSCYFLQCGPHVDPTPLPPRDFPVFARPWLVRRPRPSKPGWAGLKQSTRVPCAVDGTPRQTRADSTAAAAASTVRALVRGIRTLNRNSNHPEHLFRRIIPICFLKHHSPRVCEVLFKTRTL